MSRSGSTVMNNGWIEGSPFVLSGNKVAVLILFSSTVYWEIFAV